MFLVYVDEDIKGRQRAKQIR